jgi:tetratricopeptide (TPR) repeat protein
MLADIAYDQNQKIDEAIYHLKEAILINPYSIYAHYNLGIIYANKGLIDKAINHLNETMRIDPEYGKGYYSLARMYSLNNQKGLAISSLQQAISLVGHEATELLKIDTAFDNIRGDRDFYELLK